MAKVGVILAGSGDVGGQELTLEDLQQQIMQLRDEMNSRRHYDYLEILNLLASNINMTAGSPNTPIGTIGRDPQSNNIWGFIAERGYGFLARYKGPNYARFFVDATNDGGQLTPSAIMDMPIPNKFVFKDNESNTLFRVYGGHGQEVGFPGNDDNYFDTYNGGNNGGAFDLFVPMRYATFDYGGGTSGGPEAVAGYAWQGFAYYRQNYGSTKISDLRLFDGNAWMSVLTAHPGATAGNPVTADTVRTLEHVTVTVA